MKGLKMRRAISYVRIGIGLTTVGLALATALNLIFGLDWFFVAILALTVAGMAVIMLTFTADHPPTWGSGFWSVYVEMSGRGAAGGGLSGMTQPQTDWDVQAIVNGLLPILVASPLLILRLLM